MPAHNPCPPAAAGLPAPTGVDRLQSSREDPPSVSGLLQAHKQHKAAAAAEAPAPSPATAGERERMGCLATFRACRACRWLPHSWVCANSSHPWPHHPTRPASRLLADMLAKARELLGVQLDVSAGGLIAEALKHGMGPADDWTDYQQRHRWARLPCWMGCSVGCAACRLYCLFSVPCHAGQRLCYNQGHTGGGECCRTPPPTLNSASVPALLSCSSSQAGGGGCCDPCRAAHCCVCQGGGRDGGGAARGSGRPG